MCINPHFSKCASVGQLANFELYTFWQDVLKPITWKNNDNINILQQIQQNSISKTAATKQVMLQDNRWLPLIVR